LAGLRESLDQWLEDADGLLGRMAAVAGVDPGLHVGQRLGGKRRTALGQNVGLFVAVSEKAHAGGVALVPDDVGRPAKKPADFQACMKAATACQP